MAVEGIQESVGVERGEGEVGTVACKEEAGVDDAGVDDGDEVAGVDNGDVTIDEVVGGLNGAGDGDDGEGKFK